MPLSYRISRHHDFNSLFSIRISRIAVEAGESLSGQVVIDVEDDVDPGNLYIKLYGKEICYIRGRDTSS